MTRSGRAAWVQRLRDLFALAVTRRAVSRRDPDRADRLGALVSPQLVTAASFGSARNVLIDGALLRIEPRPVPNGTPHVAVSVGAVIAVLVLWPLAATALGAWRTRVRERDATPEADPARAS